MSLHIKRIRPIKILDVVLLYMYCGMLVLNIISVWSRKGFLWDYSNLVLLLTPVLSAAIVLMNLCKKNKFNVTSKAVWYFLIFTFCFFMCILGNPSSLVTGLTRVYIPLTSVLILLYSFNNEELKKLYSVYVNVVFAIALISLIFYIFGSILNLIGSTSTVSFEWDKIRSAKSYFGLYYEVQTSDSLFVGAYKNSGLFTEATLFGFVLNIAYILERKREKSRKFIIIVLLLTIFTTLSMTPLIAWGLFEIIDILCKKTSTRSAKAAKVLIVFPIVCIVGVITFVDLYTMKMSTASYNIRFDHIRGCIDAFISTFPFGCGYDGRDVLFRYFTAKQGVSVGILYCLALGGLGGLIMMIVPIVRYLYNAIRRKNTINVAASVSLFFLMFFTNTIMNSSLQWFILIMMIRENDRLYLNVKEIKNGIK